MNQVASRETSPTIPSFATPRVARPSQASRGGEPPLQAHGEWQDVNDGLFRCTAWRSVAENASRTLKKGMRIFLAGKLIQRSWQDNDGIKRQTVEIQVSHIGPDLQFATAEVPKSSAEGSSSSSVGLLAASPAEGK